MKKMFFCVAALALGLLPLQAQAPAVAPYLPAMSSPAAQNAPITVQYPYEKFTVPAGAQNIYLFGKINLPDPELDINGQSVPVHANGTFLAYLPVEQGAFTFLLTAQSQGQTYQAVRHITVPGQPLQTFIGKAKLDESTVYPSLPVWLLPGDVVSLSVRGTPGAEVTAELSGLKEAKHIPLKEDARTPGLYRAKYVVDEAQKARSSRVSYMLFDPQTHTRTRATAKARLKILDPAQPLQAARVTSPGTKLRQMAVRQGSLYPFYRAYGEVFIDGRDNGLYRLRLGNGESAWLEEKKVSLLSLSARHANALAEINTLATPQSTQVRWQHATQVPVSIHEFNNRLEVTFYYTPSFGENFNFDATSPLLDRMEWDDSQDGVLTFVLYFKEGQTLWGHAYRYEDNDFVLDLYHTPAHTPSKDKPLDGVRILLDAGHSPKRTPPYDGLVSPSGALEYEANLALAEVLLPKLEAAGATVIMTRRGDNHMSLPARYKKALKEQAHIFVSLHHNALPETTNPLAVPRGYSVYYTYPHSFKLAESVYKAFNRKIPLADNGLLANDVLFIPRIPDMPSILIENAFMILPEQEEMVLSEEGRELFAQTIYEGILDFYGVAPKTPKRSKSKTKKSR